MTTGQLIANLLDEKDITQRDLAKLVGVTEVTISRYINGSRQPKSDILFRIAKALNVPADYFDINAQSSYSYSNSNTETNEKLITRFDSLDVFQQNQILQIVDILIDNLDSLNGIIMFLKLDARDQGKIENSIEVILKTDKYNNLKKGQELA